MPRRTRQPTPAPRPARAARRRSCATSAARPRPCRSSGTSGPCSTSVPQPLRRCRLDRGPASADRRWLEQSRAWLAERVGVDALGPFLHEVPIGLVGLVIDRPEVATAAQLVQAIDEADFHALFRVMLGEGLRAGSPQRNAALRALDGDQEAIDALAAKSAEHHPPEHRDELEARLRDPRGCSARRRWSCGHGRAPPRSGGSRGRDDPGRRGAPRRRPGHPRATRPDRAHDERRPMGLGAEREPAGSSRRRTSHGPTTRCSPARTGGCSATRSPTRHSTAATRSRRRRPSSGCIGRSVTDAAGGSCGSSGTGNATSPRSPRRWALEADRQAPPRAPPLGRALSRSRTRAPTPTTRSGEIVSSRRAPSLRAFLLA